MSLLPHEPLALLQPCRRVWGNRICSTRLMQNLRRRHPRFDCVQTKRSKGKKEDGHNVFLNDVFTARVLRLTLGNARRKPAI
ncbi:hypothetical protein DPMN_191490 [Dreissena polymorpha]|uniref:Uncharacterized protein n=1 Tax=Dreissena polymorpha TaxID=45954 RepID=A0A9D3Y307_DREPO|nr:hypothetical protein DPMN_191490 [Dreissena polymorpha]